MTLSKQELLNHIANFTKSDPNFVSEMMSKLNLPPSLNQPDLASVLSNLSHGQPLKKFEKGDDFVTFCKRFTEHTKLIYIPIANHLPYFLQCINDDTVYNQLKSVKLTPEQSIDCDSFINEFKKAIYDEDAFFLKNKLLDCSQNSSESVQEYADRLCQKASIACPNNPSEADEFSLMAFIRGVSDRRIKLHLNTISFIYIPSSFASAVKSAKLTERAYLMCNPLESSTRHDPYPLLRQREFTDYDEIPRSSHDYQNDEYRAHSRSRSRIPQSRNYSRDKRFRSQASPSSEDF